MIRPLLAKLATVVLAATTLLAPLPAAARPTPAWRGLPPRVGPPLVGHAMIAAANPLAAEAGLKVLRAGGSAVDAAVAIQAVLGLVEPQSSGLGGGAFMVFYDAAKRSVVAYDGRETAPSAARPTLFYGDDGRPLDFVDAVLSGRSTGAPGAIAMLELAHRSHGRRPWGSLFGSAERLARDGFVVSPRLAGMIASRRAPQAQARDARAYFADAQGAALQAGARLRNPLYADALARIAREGAAGLLTGVVAKDIVQRIADDPRPGALSLADLRGYRPLARRAACRPYHVYLICAPPPPAGGTGLLELMGVLEHTDIGARGPADPAAWVAFAGASRLAYADRDRYVGDPTFVHVPTAGMLDPDYDAARAALIPSLSAAVTLPGAPPGANDAGADATPEPGGTSSFVVVDARGNVVSMTTTVESIFGSGRMAHGFFLNNQLTDFSFAPTDPDGAPAANAPGPAKRPRSSMTPVIVLDRHGGFVAAVGSPGGASIIAYVAKALVAMIDWGLDPQAAVALPNLVARPAKVSLEKGADPEIARALRATGVAVESDAGEESGLHAVVRVGARYVGGADPRREGVARGW